MPLDKLRIVAKRNRGRKRVGLTVWQPNISVCVRVRDPVYCYISYNQALQWSQPSGCFAEGGKARLGSSAFRSAAEASLPQTAPAAGRRGGGEGGGCPAMACWSRSALLWLLAGACGLALLGYCVYFDRKRRNATDFKQRLRESKSRGRESGRPCGLFPALGRRRGRGCPC